MAITPEREAQFKAELEEIIDRAEQPTPTLLGTRPPLPVLVCRDGKIVGDCTVVVSEDDPNWWRSMAVREGGKITLRGGMRCR